MTPALPNALRLALGLLILGGAVFFVLHAGRDLRPPPRLATTWSVGATACAGAGDRLELSQSGVFLHVRWPGGPVPELEGRLEGDGVRLAGVASACGGGDARATGTWTPGALRLDLAVPGCDRCSSGTLEGAPAP